MLHVFLIQLMYSSIFSGWNLLLNQGKNLWYLTLMHLELRHTDRLVQACSRVSDLCLISSTRVVNTG